MRKANVLSCGIGLPMEAVEGDMNGLRIGTPAVTTRGFGEAEVRELTGWICDILDDIDSERTIERVRGQVAGLCDRFPV